MQLVKLQRLNTSSSSSLSSSEEDIAVRRPKIYRKRKNYFEIYDELDFFDRFRLSKHTFRVLLSIIEHDIKLPSNRGGCIQPMIQLLLTLRFLATGSMLIATADFVGVSKSSASRIIKRVCEAIARLHVTYINMPQSNEEKNQTVLAFYRKASFPKCIGAIDCTLIKIQSPGGDDAEIFRCRKGFFAINVQTVSDATLKIRNIVARWPGSVHDQTIFNNSVLKRQFEEGRYGKYLLVGDSGYRIERYLMTKLEEANTNPENLYNESIIRTRNVVERQYGVWKRRFPILSQGIRLNLDTSMTVIVATAVLHNLALEMHEEIPNDWIIIVDNEVDDIEHQDVNNRNVPGRQFRQLLINEHFARL